MKRKLLKDEKGITTGDIVAAIFVLIIFISLIGTLFYKVIYNSNMIKMNSIAVHYSIKLAEDIDKIQYEDINNAYLTQYINENYDLPVEFSMIVKVENYNEENEAKEDVLKIVTIHVDYECINETESYELKKLKVKEM